MPWKNATSNDATFDLFEKMAGGISGYFASFNSLKKKRIDIKPPNTSKQMTVAELQGNTSPPRLRPRSSISVTPRIEMLPGQSIAFSPSRAFVLGL